MSDFWVISGTAVPTSYGTARTGSPKIRVRLGMKPVDRASRQRPVWSYKFSDVRSCYVRLALRSSTITINSEKMTGEAVEPSASNLHNTIVHLSSLLSQEVENHRTTMLQTRECIQAWIASHASVSACLEASNSYVLFLERKLYELILENKRLETQNLVRALGRLYGAICVDYSIVLRSPNV